jgi:hypothetical protein
MAKTKVMGIIELSCEEAMTIMERIKEKELVESDYVIFELLLTERVRLYNELQEKNLAIKRLKGILNIKTEKLANLLKEENSPDSRVSGEDESTVRGDKSELVYERQNKKGHGRNGVSSYPDAERIKVEHHELKAGDKCPECPRGRLFCMKKPALVLRITGHAPLQARVYELEKLRCSSCQKIFTAGMSAEAGGKKYDEKAGAIISLLKYGNGFPFYRLKNLQKEFGIPLPAATQWEVVEGVGNVCYPIYRELINQGAQGEVIHNDDTGVKILSLMKEIEREKKGRPVCDQEEENMKCDRKGMFTTGIVSKAGKREIALYFSGRNHSGENLEEVLRRRSKSLGPPVQMCDAEARNTVKERETNISNCLAHGRRKFIDLADTFPAECRVVIEALAEVYVNDRITKEQDMPGGERLRFHQCHSGPVMNRLRCWLDRQFEEREVEPNSSLGGAIKYMQKHWEKLTMFLRVENAPLDNNAAERILKKVILHRKNAYFYKTESGAAIGDILMSVIQACNLAGINAFEYLVAIQKHAGKVLLNPEQWLPWKYKSAHHS